MPITVHTCEGCGRKVGSKKLKKIGRKSLAPIVSMLDKGRMRREPWNGVIEKDSQESWLLCADCIDRLQPKNPSKRKAKKSEETLSIFGEPEPKRSRRRKEDMEPETML